MDRWRRRGLCARAESATISEVAPRRSNGTAAKAVPAGLPAGAPYFATMTIGGVRCFGPDQELSLVDDDGRVSRWTLLLGENGVGKTTLLQVLALLASPDTREVEHLLEFEMFEQMEWRTMTRRRARRPPDLAARLARPRTGARATATFRHRAREFTHTIVADDVGWESSGPLKQAPFLCGYGASRRLGDGGLRSRRPREAGAFLSLFVDTELRDAEEWLLQADYAAARDADDREARRRVDVVMQLLVRVLPEATAVRIGKSRDYPLVEVETPYGWVPISGLSLGYQTLIAWMVDLASRFLERFEGQGDPFAQPAIVLVDEIDLHLHPRWQRQLMGYLTDLFPATQFIATAHSPLVVQAAEHANIVVLRREEDHVVIEAQLDEVKNWRVDQILTSDLYGLPSARPPHLDALLTERRDILTKRQVSPADERRLRVLEREIGSLPGGQTPEEMRAMEIIERAAKLADRPRRRGKK